MERTWEREDIVSSEEEFAEMAKAVAHYVHKRTSAYEAVGLVASIRSKEHGDLGRILDALYDALEMKDPVSADRELTKAINKKREIRNHQQEKVSE